MYLSKLTKADSRKEMFPNEDTYEYHKLAWSFFPGTKDRGWLYRVEPKFIYMLSDVEPINTSDTPWVVQTKPFNPVVEAGDRLQFDTRLNATVCRPNGRVNKKGAPKGKRCSVVRNSILRLKDSGMPRDRWPGRGEILHGAMSDWFKERKGFQVESLQIGAYHQYRFMNKKGYKQQFDSVDCRGTLRVTDVDAFLDTLAHGLGRERAFGCGLILIRRI